MPNQASHRKPVCDVCGRPVVMLFLSTACDWCDGNSNAKLYRGYVVWRGRKPGRREYVFRTRKDAERWGEANGLGSHPVRVVACEAPFAWRTSAGSIQELEFAEGLYEVFSTRQFRAGPNRVFLVSALHAAPQLQAS